MNGFPERLRQVDLTRVEWRGRRWIYFGGCDYFRLSRHPRVLAAAREALEKHGFGVAASRLTTGNHPLFAELETWLARFFRAARALLVDSGYATNPIVTRALAGDVTHAFLDARAHASLRDAAAELDCPITEFPHCDPDGLQRLLRRLPARAKPLVMTDGVFSHDGSLAPLPAYLEILPKAGRLLVDDAHGVGTLGNQGRGTLEECGVRDPRVIVTGTLSKAFGAFGGFVLGNPALIDRIVAGSRWFGASTPMPLPAVAAALAAGELIANDLAMRDRLRTNTAQIKTAARAAGFAVPDNAAPMMGLALPEPTANARLRRALLARGVYPSHIRYPGGPVDGFFRFAISSEHPPAAVERLLDALRVAAG